MLSGRRQLERWVRNLLGQEKNRRITRGQTAAKNVEAVEARLLLTAKPFATSDAIHATGPNGSADFYAQPGDLSTPPTGFEEYGIASITFTKADFGLGASQTITSLNSATLTLTHNDRTFTSPTSFVEFFFTPDDFAGDYSFLSFDNTVHNGISNASFSSAPVAVGAFDYIANPAGSPNTDTYTLVFDPTTEAALIGELNNESEFSIMITGTLAGDSITYSGVGNTFDPGDPVLDLDVNATAAAGAEISVEGNSTIIVDGDTTPDAADGTDFGAIDTATGSETRTFTIENTGSADLDVSAINLTGANSGDFSIQNFTAGAVAPSGSLTFDVVFDPAVDGLREATVEIVNDDSDENPFDFSIQGVGTTAGVSALDSIVFNELLADPNGANNFDTDGDGSAEAADEFVEIYNTSTDSLDIGGLEFWDGSGGNYFTIPLGTTLGPNGFVVVVASVAGGSLPTVDAGSHAFSPGGGMSLSNGGEDVVLYDPVNEVYIQAIYNGNTPDDPTTYSGISATATIAGSIVDLGNDIDGVSVALSPDGDTANATPHNAIGDGSILATPGASNTAPVAGPPSFAIAAADADKAESNAGAAETFTFTVTRSGDTSAANDVDYAVTGSSVNQADGSDFQGAALPSGTLNFAAGEASQTVEIIVNGDNDIEPDEGFTVTLSNATGGASISTATADGVIRNDDTAAPEFAITATDASKPEGNSGTTDFTFTVERTGNTVGMDTVEFDVTSALTDGADAADFFGGSFPSGTVTFNDSETTATITIQVAGDMDIEATEGFTVTLSNPSRSGTLSTPSADGSIIDDDAPPPIVWINEFHYDDEGTDDNEFVEVAGTAGTDLTDWSIVLYNGSNGTSYNTTTLSGVIDDEDSGIGAVSFAISGIQNGAPDAIALVNALGTLVEFISYEGVLTGVGGPADGVTSVDVGVSETNTDAPGQSLQRTNSDTGGWFGPTDDSPGDLNTIPVPEFAIVAQDADKAEGSGGGTITFTFLVIRSGDTTQANDVDYAVTGSVTDGVDANDFSGGALPSGTLSFPAGETTLPISLEVNADSDIEPDEGIIVTLSNPTAGATITNDTATGTVQNDDAAAPEFSIVATDAALSEGDNGLTNFTFTVTRSANTTGPDTVDFAVTGAAVDGADAADFVGPTLPGGTVSFGDGVTTQTITIEVAGDMTAEANEGFIVTLSNPSRSGTLNPDAANGTILDDDTPPANAWINEFHYDNSGADVGEFIEVAGDAGIDLSGFTIVQYNGSNGLAYGSIPLTGTIDDEGGSGFGALSFTPTDAFQNGNDAFALVDASNRVLDFVSYEGAFDANDGPAAGMTAVDVGVEESAGGPEGVSLQRDNASSPANTNPWAGPFAESPGDLNTIPTPVFSIVATDADKAEGNGGGNTPFTFTVTRSENTSGTDEVTYSFAMTFFDSADAGDFDGGTPGGTLTFGPGETTQVITLNVIGDEDVEADEGFIIFLTPAIAAEGTIRNDDSALDPLSVTVTLDDISENGGSSSGTVSIPSNAASDLTVTLTSSDPTEALVTSTVTISAGTSSASFTVTGQDDSDFDGTQTVTITAQASGFADGTDTIDILDDEVLLEFGDAPSAAQSGFAASYPVTLAEDGARHGDSGATLGGGLDLESDGVHSANADADDMTDTGSSDDEDGVVFAGALIASPLATSTGSVEVDLQDPHPTSNLLDAWIDFNQDGDWTDPGEQIFTSFDLGTISGVQTLNFNIPQDAGANVVDGTTFSRFRLSASGGLGVQGAAPDGEVEDHPVTISTLSPALTLTINAASISENGGTSQATVTRNTGTTGALTVDLFSGDTSEATVPSMVTIPDGSDSVTFTINAVDDAILDGTQTVTITAEATGFADGTDTIDVIDDEEPTLTVTTALSEISENGGSSVATVSRNSGTSGDLVVMLSSNDTSEATVPMSVTIPDGLSSVNFTITAVDDAIADGTQTVFITALADAFLTGFDSIDILDDESPLLTVSIDEVSISENGGTSSATVTRNTGTSGDLTVSLMSDDTSEATVPATVTILDGADSATFTIMAVNDAIADATQTVTVTASSAGFTPGSDTVDVIDDEVAALTLNVVPTTLSEDGRGTATGTVSRNTNAIGDLIVTLTSTDLSEARVPTSITIPDGQASVDFEVTAVDDVLVDGTQVVTIRAMAPLHATDTFNVEVTDDDIGLTIDSATISENGGTAIGTLTRDPAIGDVVVTLVSSDPSEATVPSTVTIPDGQASQTFTIVAQDDTILDGTQTVLISPTAQGFSTSSDTIDVLDDEVPLLTISIDELSISENGGSSSATVTRNTGTVGDLTVDLFSDDTTEATVPATVTILDGTDSATFTITAFNDAILDGTQTVTITAQATGLDDGTDEIDVTDDEVVATTLLINEVLMDPPEALDTGLEYIELRGEADAFLATDSYLVLLEGDSTSDPGNIDHVFTLAGLQFDSNGFLLLDQNGSNGWDQSFSSRTTDIENGSVSFLVITSAAAPVPDTDVDSNDDGTLDGAALLWTIEDSIGNIQGRADDTGYGAINVSGSGMGLTPVGSTLVDITAQPLLTSFFHPDYVGRNGDSTGSAQDDWVFAEIDGSAPNHVLAFGATVPSNLGGAPLDHLAATNAFDAPETLTVDIAPTSLDEGDTTTVTVSRTGEDISGALTVNVAVDSGRATVPVSVNIAADDASATFTLEAVQNTDVDGDVIVTVTASAAGGFTDGTDSVEVINDDVAPANVWINEFHYDDEGADDNEFVEVAGTAGIDLAGFSIVLYNGNGGGEYFTEALSGTIDDEGSSGFGALAFPIGNIQNGAPDGIALVDAGGAVLQFVSYEGTLTATNGPANGLTSVDVGVRESNGDPAGLSLQRNNAIPANDNPWVGPLDDSPGDLNVIPPPAFTITATNADRLEGSDGGTTTFVFTVTRTGDTSGANDVDFAVSGAATDGADAADFAGGLASGTLMFAAGETSTVILLDVNADTDIEPDEGFIVTLSNATGGASIDTATATGTIENDDAAAPDFAIAALDAVQTEGDSGSTDFTFTVTRSANTSGSDTVDFAVAGAAVDGADADDFAGGVLPSDTVTFADGEVSQTITISVASDTDVEPSEDFIVTLSNASRSGTLSVISANGTILDDDTPPANAWINEFHYDDAGSDNGEFVEVAGSAGIDLSGFSIVLYNGSNGASYNTVGLTGAIDDEGSGFGAVSFAISGIQNGAPDGIALVDDTGRVLQFVSYEGSLEATNGPASGLTSVDVGVAETSTTPEGVSLQRNNSPAPAADNPWGGPFPESPGDLNVFPAAVFEITADDAVQPEGNAGLTDFTFTVTRSINTGGTNSVEFAVTGAAVDGADADDFGGALPTGTVDFAAGETTQTITVQVSGDTDAETDEGFIVTLSNPTDGATIATATAEGTIQNDDNQALTLSIDALTIDENGTATATISRTGDTSSALLVEIVSDDASEVSHPVMVTIPANEESTTFVVSGVDDGVVDGTQSALLTATAPGHSPDTAGLDVTDIQSATVSIEGTVNGSELDPTNGEFTISISTAPEADVVVPYTIGGSAVEGVDFAPLSGSVTIIGGTTEATIDVVVLDDLIAELGTDRLELTLEEPVGPLAITVDPLAGSDGIFISDDDLASISVSTNSLTVDETGAFSTATFEVVLTSEPTGDVLINIASSDSAEAVASPLEILFDETNWNTPRTVTVSGRDDGIADGTQLANISLTIDHLTTASRAAEYQLADPTATVVVDVNDTNAVPTAEVERVTFFNEDADVERNFSLDRTGQRSIIRRAEVVVSDVVTVTDASAFTATRTDDGSSVGVSLISATPVNGKTIIVLEFNGGNVDAGGLIDGNYQLQIDGGALGAGGVETHAFHRLFGDSDGDRDVDGADFGAYIGGLFFGSSTANSLFDLNDDDNLFGELASFFSNFGRVLR